MKKPLLTLLLSILVSITIISCGSDEKKLVARINGAPLTESEFNSRVVSQMLAFVPGGDVRSVPPEARAQIKKSVFTSLVGRELLFQAAVEQNVAASEDDVTLEISKKRSSFGSEREFQEQLRMRGLTEIQFRAELHKELTIDNYLDWMVDNKPEKELGDPLEFYSENTEQFKEPETAHVNHIFLALPGGADDSARKSKLSLAAELKSRLAGGADFADIATEFSDSKDAESGGDLGYIERGAILEPLEATVFNMDRNDPPVIVETPFGVHLVLVLERKEERLVPFEEVEQRISAHLKQEARTAGAGEKIKALLESATIDTIEQSLKKG